MALRGKTRPKKEAGAPAFVERRSRAPKWALAGALIGLAVGAAASIPAQAVAAWAASASSGRVVLAEAKGTLWSGSAIVEIAAPSGKSIALDGRASWSAGLGWSGPRLELRSPSCGGAAVVAAVSWSGTVKVGAFDCRLPPEALGMSAGSWSAMSPRGTVKLAANGLELARSPLWIKGEGDLEIQGLCLSVSKACPLGSYKARWSAMGAKALFDVSSIGPGALDIQGHGDAGWGASPGSSFSGTAKAGQGAQGEVENLLALMGSRSGDQAHVQWGTPQ